MPASDPGRAGRSLRAVAAVSLAAWFALAIWHPAPAGAAFVGRNDWLVFSAIEPDGSVHVWRQGPEGMLLDLTGTSFADPVRDHVNFSPAWSPEQGSPKQHSHSFGFQWR